MLASIAMDTNIRVRFAPSPTGFLHVGGARTALFNWLFARANQGKFLLRIEDTDVERSEARFTDDIMESLRWLGFDWDEPPVFQSQRFARYQQIAKELLEKSLAYRCDCSTEKLGEIRKQCDKEKKAFRYPGLCLDKKNVNPPFVLRIKVPHQGQTTFHDLVRGDITMQHKDIDDWVILRANGTPTYNFSVVIDDNDQAISHILRGDDHINNTPKQILLYQTLGFDVPKFAHLPMILGSDRTKLSKRHGAGSTLDYRKMGYLPDALSNFLVRLGWSHKDQEIFSREELFKYFSLENIGKANAIFNTEKLVWISGHYMRETPAEKLLEYMRRYFADSIVYDGVLSERLIAAIRIIQGKVKTILELIDQMNILFGADPAYDISTMAAADKNRISDILNRVVTTTASLEFRKDELDKAIRQVANDLGEKLVPIAQAIRLAVTGGKVSPGLFEMLEVMGKETSRQRIQNLMSILRS